MFYFGEIFYTTFLPSKSRFHRNLCKRKSEFKIRNDSLKIVSCLSTRIFYAIFLPSKWRCNRKLCKRKTQPKNRNDSLIIACFFFHENFFKQGFIPVNDVLIASYANIKRDSKSATTAWKAHVLFRRDFFMQLFRPVNHVLIAIYQITTHVDVKQIEKGVKTRRPPYQCATTSYMSMNTQ